MKQEKVGFLMCPPVSKYSLPPSDHSASTTIDCPICNQKIWISIKKQSLKKEWESMNRKMIIACYTCIMEMAKDGVFSNSDIIRIDI